MYEGGHAVLNSDILSVLGSNFIYTLMVGLTKAVLQNEQHHIRH